MLNKFCFGGLLYYYIMKIIKKILAGAVSAAVLVSTLAVPTAALSSTMTHKFDGGTLTMLNGIRFSYSTDTAASYTYASASMSCSRSANLLATITANGIVDSDVVNPNTNRNMVSGTSASASVNNMFDYSGVKKSGTITSAVGKYYINSDVVATTTVV
ncbi:MAG: hypothetical protein K2K41_02185 [Ruminiclostridium sp.]|nr:hypothetical protein [Ruminiclostridium sp.]